MKEPKELKEPVQANCVIYASTHRPSPAVQKTMDFLIQTLSRRYNLIYVFRYKFPFLSDPKYQHLNLHFLYDDFTELNDEEVTRYEKDIDTPFNTIRYMTRMSRARYPRLDQMADDRFMANTVRAWQKLFREKKIDLVVNSLNDDYVSMIEADVAKRMGIPTVNMHTSRFSNAMILCDHTFYPVFFNKLPASKVDETFDKATAAVRKETILNPGSVGFVEKRINMFSPVNLLNLVRAGLANLRYYYLTIPPIERKLWYSPWELMRRQIGYFTRSSVAGFFFDQKPVPGEKFVFFPLHFMDDTMMTSKSPFIDQFDLVEHISRALPHGVKLYVKPHPHWRGADLETARVRKLKRIPNIRLLQYTTNTKQLIRQCEYTIIINSSVGFECMALGKKVVSFGSEYPPDVIPRIDRPEQLFRIDELHMDEAKVKEYVANLYTHSFYFPEEDYMQGSVSRDEDAQLLADMIDKAYRFILSRDDGPK